jgi:hypothetical protein
METAVVAAVQSTPVLCEFDVVGHHSRPDVFHLEVNRGRA